MSKSSLGPFYKVSYHMNWVKTCWTYSTLNSTFTQKAKYPLNVDLAISLRGGGRGNLVHVIYFKLGKYFIYLRRARTALPYTNIWFYLSANS